MKFRKDNLYAYGQDFRFFKGVPADVDFTIRRCSSENLYMLVADGYGEKHNYGNGAIFISPNARLKKRFVRELSRSESTHE